MFAVLGTGASMGQAMLSMAAGPGDGFGAVSSASAGKGSSESGAGGTSSSGPPAGPSSAGESSSGNAGAGVSASAVASGGAPAGPSTGGRAMGQFRAPNVPHAIGWMAGAAAALGVQGGQQVAQRLGLSGKSDSD
jgi:hypothetical protein